jgi:predicted nuclease of predicted toxin-antitoxin system
VRILANENMPADAVDALRSAGHDVAWVRVDAPGSPDEAVLARAAAEHRLLITFDKDFGDLVFARGRSASDGVVLFRIEMPSPSVAATKIVTALASRTDWAGHFSVVDDTKIRMVPLPSPPNP